MFKFFFGGDQYDKEYLRELGAIAPVLVSTLPDPNPDDSVFYFVKIENIICILPDYSLTYYIVNT